MNYQERQGVKTNYITKLLNAQNYQRIDRNLLYKRLIKNDNEQKNQDSSNSLKHITPQPSVLDKLPFQSIFVIKSYKNGNQGSRQGGQRQHCTFHSKYSTPEKFVRGPLQQKQTLYGTNIRRDLMSPTLISKCYTNVKSAQVFVIDGNYPDVRKSLQNRGWVENTTNSYSFDLKWARSSKIPKGLKQNQLFNHFPRIYQLTTKAALCRNLYKGKTRIRLGVDEFYPRSYKLYSVNHQTSFINYYKTLHAVNLLIEHKKGRKVWIEKLQVALQVADRMANYFQNPAKISSLDYPCWIYSHEWRVLNSTNMLEIRAYGPYVQPQELESIENRINTVLSSLNRNNPQFKINGWQNVWIIKPGRKSRGREIAISKDLNDIQTYNNPGKAWVVQKYIENPLLIMKRKFDIRQWVLITQLEPIEAWFYDECYLRFSSEEYDASQLQNSFIHLTNNCIQINSNNFQANQIEGCMWHLGQFIQFLEEQNLENFWQTTIRPNLEKIVIKSITAVKGKIINRENSFELVGYDFMLDADYRTWLIEANSSPALDYSTVIYIQKITERMVKEMLGDAVKVVVDRIKDSNADTGKFKLIKLD